MNLTVFVLSDVKFRERTKGPDLSLVGHLMARQDIRTILKDTKVEKRSGRGETESLESVSKSC